VKKIYVPLITVFYGQEVHLIKIYQDVTGYILNNPGSGGL